MMTEHTDPRDVPEQMRSWRFYDNFRSDAEAPARQPQLGTYGPRTLCVPRAHRWHFARCISSLRAKWISRTLPRRHSWRC